MTIARVCLIPGCGKPVQGRGLCSAHYRAQRELRPLVTSRTSPGKGGKVMVRVKQDIINAVREAAAREGVNASEWWRRAALERLKRQKAGEK